LEAVDEAMLVSAFEVVGSKVAIIDAFLEHDVDGGEHGSGYRDDGLLGAARISLPQRSWPSIVTA
jgi:hypothetical protein